MEKWVWSCYGNRTMLNENRSDWDARSRSSEGHQELGIDLRMALQLPAKKTKRLFRTLLFEVKRILQEGRGLVRARCRHIRVATWIWSHRNPRFSRRLKVILFTRIMLFCSKPRFVRAWAVVIFLSFFWSLAYTKKSVLKSDKLLQMMLRLPFSAGSW